VADVYLMIKYGRKDLPEEASAAPGGDDQGDRGPSADKEGEEQRIPALVYQGVV
jgi:hypothetical protein